MTEIIETTETVEATELLTRKEVSAMIAAANSAIVSPIRKVHASLVDDVIERTYLETDGLNKKSRNFAIRKAVGNYIDLVTKGLTASAADNHFDLLTPAHPYSSSATALSDKEVRDLRAQWVAAEPGIKNEYRPIVAAALSLDPGSMEAVHAEIRVMALTAAGELPAHLTSYGPAITASALADFDYGSLREEEYQETRDALFSLVVEQKALTASGALAYDVDGSLARRIYRGDSRKSIISHLERSAAFNAAVESLDADLTFADPFTIQAREQFSQFFDALTELADSPRVIDLREIAADSVAKYDETGEIAQAITAGADSKYVLAKLSDVAEWNDDLADFNLLSEEEDLEDEKFSAWAQFNNIYESVLDIDGEMFNHVPLRVVVPSK